MYRRLAGHSSAAHAKSVPAGGASVQALHRPRVLVGHQGAQLSQRDLFGTGRPHEIGHRREVAQVYDLAHKIRAAKQSRTLFPSSPI